MAGFGPDTMVIPHCSEQYGQWVAVGTAFAVGTARAAVTSPSVGIHVSTAATLCYGRIVLCSPPPVGAAGRRTHRTPKRGGQAGHQAFAMLRRTVFRAVPVIDVTGGKTGTFDPRLLRSSR